MRKDGGVHAPTCQGTTPHGKRCCYQLSCPLGVQRHQIIQGYNLQLSCALPRLWRMRQLDCLMVVLLDCCFLLQTAGCAAVPCVSAVQSHARSSSKGEEGRASFPERECVLPPAVPSFRVQGQRSTATSEQRTFVLIAVHYVGRSETRKSAASLPLP